MWVKQHMLNDCDTEGYYSTKVWAHKPALFQIAGKSLQELEEEEIIKAVRLYRGEEVDGERIIETNPDGSIPYRDR